MCYKCKGAKIYWSSRSEQDLEKNYDRQFCQKKLNTNARATGPLVENQTGRFRSLLFAYSMDKKYCNLKYDKDRNKYSSPNKITWGLRGGIIDLRQKCSRIRHLFDLSGGCVAQQFQFSGVVALTHLRP